jgi:molybdopterin-guanine dinucleotide biosynthesis protein A
MTEPATYGLILAGGLARRMGGGDKALLRVGSQTILERTINTLGPQCTGLLLNANGDITRFARFGLPVARDAVEDYAGPLAGILAGLDWVAHHAPGVAWVASVPGDCPFLPTDLVARMQETRGEKNMPIACARSDERRHPVIGLWPVRLRDDLRHALAAGVRKIEAWTTAHGVAVADWNTEPIDPFFNVNMPEDVARAEAIAAFRA